MKHDIKYTFISYSSENQQSANAVRVLLMKNNIKCWMAPYDIPVGSKYACVINDAIEHCSCFVLLLTEDSQNSEFVEKEVERAVTYKKIIIPIMLGNIELNSGFRFYLGNCQIIAMKQIDEKSLEWNRALSAIKSIVGVTVDGNIIEYNMMSENMLSQSGELRNEISWKLLSDGRLYIKGSGKLIASTLYGQYLDEVSVDSHLKDIKDKVKKLYIDEGIESIGKFSFFDFSELSEVYIPNTVKKINAGAFKNCHKLKRIEMGCQVEEIGLSAFENCCNLENFNLPDNIVISSEAFKNCYSLTKIVKKDAKFIKLYQRVFENCKNLKYVELRNVDWIGANAFKNCPLDTVKIHFRSKCCGEILQDEAFASSGVMEIYLNVPDSHKISSMFYTIGEACFRDCKKLSNIYFEDAVPFIDAHVFSKEQRVRIHIKKDKRNSILIKKCIDGGNCEIEYMKDN